MAEHFEQSQSIAIYADKRIATHFLYPGADPRFVLPINSRARIVALHAFMSPHEWAAFLWNNLATPNPEGVVVDELTLRVIRSLCGQGEVAVSLGTPGPHNKSTLLILDKRSHVVAYGKLADRPASIALLENEANWLGLLTAQKLAGRTPQLLALRRMEDRGLLLQTPLFGRRPFKFSNPQADFLKSLQALQPQVTRVQDSKIYQNIILHFSAAESYLPMCWAARWRRGMLRLKSYPEDLLVVPAHRDFVWWNMVVKNGSLGVFDWEYANAGYVPAYDIFHFQLFPKILRGILPTNLERLCASTGALMNSYGFPCGTSSGIKVQLIAYLLDVAASRIQSWQEWKDDPLVNSFGRLLDVLC